uniref:Uncharacterized protein n=1 Tax=Siphoviridae sp. ctD3x5 TaxID=2825384 RepID=A0A8S5PZM6_9CAUD|nr:MAG TPA: hypothetical protein [Siphoviridae sp. ctD3x5]
MDRHGGSRTNGYRQAGSRKDNNPQRKFLI